MFRLAGRIISENDWCNSSICAIVPDIQVYSCPLSVNQTFSKAKWSMESAEPHSIICTASGYPLKGLHMVLRAVALLKKAYPDIRLYVPGQKMVSDDSVQWRLRKRGYTKYIEQLIKELGIEKQIVWLGRLSQEQLAEQYSRTSVFVLSSSIENHSSTLKEAMMVGVPSVASAVGGIPEYVRHGENGFLYRFEEYEIMAGYIKRLFDDKVLAVKLSEAARRDMIRLHSGTDVYETMSDIYKQILEEKR
jgi:glycosyltransferase involved in cell wall biosynthesis